MERVVWGVLVSFIITVSVAVFIVWLNVENNSKVHQEQRESIAKNRVQLELIHDLLNKMQQDMQQQQMNETNKHSELQRPIAFDLLRKIQQEIEHQGKEIANDRVKVSKWQQELQTSIGINQNETANSVKEVQRDIATIRDLQEQSITILQQDTQKSKDAIADNRVKQEQSKKTLENISQILSKMQSELSAHRDETSKNIKSLEQLQRDHKELRSLLNIHPGLYRSCKDVQTKASGMYNIRGKNSNDTFVAYCEQGYHGGGWMVIQHRFDGSLSFDRNWADYRNGFGELDGEHWLGLEHVYQFTRAHDCELLVTMKDFYNNSKYATYSSFGIGSEAEQYRLTTLGKHTGTAGDSLQFHKGMKFSTPDRDNDTEQDYNCAKNGYGGWWFLNCYFASLNALYRNASGRNVNRIAWNGFNDDWRGLSYSRMLIRPWN